MTVIGIGEPGSEQGVALPPPALAIYRQEEVAKFLATASADGAPNVALIVSQTPVEDGTVIFGEFMMVKTLSNLRENPRVASLAVTPKLEMAGFTADVTGWVRTGPYIERINSIDFFRYNAYAGIHNVGVARIRKITPMPPKASYAGLAAGYLLVRGAGGDSGSSTGQVGVPGPVRAKYNSIASIKALSFVGEDGYPCVLPAFSVTLKESGCLKFLVAGYNRELRKLKPDTPVAVCVLTMDLMTYQVKGPLVRVERRTGVECGVLEVREVYSSMPPLCGERIA